MNASRSEREGVWFAVGAFTCFVLADTCIKAVGVFRPPAYEVVAYIGVLEMVLLAAQAKVRGSFKTLWPKHPARPLLRSGLDLINNLCVVIALRHLPLALFYILVFLAPAVTTLLEALFLKEPLTWKRWLALGTGFAGVVVAVNPFGSVRADGQMSYRLGYLACAVCVLCFSANMVWSRRLTQDESAESLTFFSSLAQGVLGSLLMLRHPVLLSLHATGLLGCTAVVSILGSLCFFLALKHASAATVSQFHYTQLVTGAGVAYLLWREKPTIFMLAGAVLIVFSGWVAASIARSPPLEPELVAEPEVNRQRLLAGQAPSAGP